MPRELAPRPVVAKLHDLAVGQTADVFALLAEKTRNTTRDNKPFFSLKFKDARRTVGCVVWADSGTFEECEKAWQAGAVYKVRATYVVHEKYGPQIEVHRLRDVTPADKPDGYNEADFFDRSRFDSDAMFADVRKFAETEIADGPLRELVLSLLDTHAATLKLLPATPRHFYPFPGGWLEHVRNVSQSAARLADEYAARFPELTPPLNRDLVVAGAILHDIGRVAELIPPLPGCPAEQTIPGRLIGHLMLGRDIVRDAGKAIPDLHPERLLMLEHIVLTHLSLPEWGSPRLPMIPEVLILHHADDLDAKFEMFARVLTRDGAEGPFTDRDPILGKALLKGRSV